MKIKAKEDKAAKPGVTTHSAAAANEQHDGLIVVVVVALVTYKTNQ